MEKNRCGEPIECDVLVIGAGGAGMRAAIEASRRGAKVAIADKRTVGFGGATVTGLYTACAALGHTDPEDNWEIHFDDTLKGGYYVNHHGLARLFAQKAPEAMAELDSFGADFERRGDKFDLRGAPGHSYRRSLFSDCATGRAMIKGLIKEFKKHKGIWALEYTLALELVLDSGRACGAICLDLVSGKLFRCLARAVIIATGGATELYPETTAPSTLTGDGYAMAYRAGAELRDMEFVQFFPVGLVHPRGFGINPTIGAMMRYRTGGRLLNRFGEAFMPKYDPVRGDMALRDVLAYGITREIMEGRGTPRGAVYLDLTGPGPGALRKEYGSYLDIVKAGGIDVTKEPIEVRPMAHHFMGGIAINDKCETSLPGLYAAGEAASGLHGANRLAGNALSEIIVFGAAAGAEAANFAQMSPQPKKGASSDEERLWLSKLDYLLSGGDGGSPVETRKELQNVMKTFAGPIRDGAGLAQALNLMPRIEGVTAELRTSSKSPIFNMEATEALEMENLSLMAKIVLQAALIREERRGAHFRTDFSGPDPSWKKNIYVLKGSSGPLFERRRVIEN